MVAGMAAFAHAGSAKYAMVLLALGTLALALPGAEASSHPQLSSWTLNLNNNGTSSGTVTLVFNQGVKVHTSEADTLRDVVIYKLDETSDARLLTPMTGNTMSISGATVTITLTPDHKLRIDSMTDIGTGLYVSNTAFRATDDNTAFGGQHNLNGGLSLSQAGAQHQNFRTFTRDGTAPGITGATLVRSSGALTITSDDPINPASAQTDAGVSSNANASRYHIRDGTGQTSGGQNLQNIQIRTDLSSFQVGQNWNLIRSTLSGNVLTAVNAMSNPTLYVDADTIHDIRPLNTAAEAQTTYSFPANKNAAIADIDINYTPAPAGATYDPSTGVLTVTFSEDVTAGSASGTPMFVSNAGRASSYTYSSSSDVALAAPTSAASSQAYTLSSSQQTLVTGMTNPTLYARAGALQDSTGLESASEQTPVGSTAAPTLTKADLRPGNGSITVTFDQSVSAVATSPGLIYVASTGSSSYNSGTDVLFTAGSSASTIHSDTFDAAELARIRAMTTPLLYMEASAVTTQTTANAAGSIGLQPYVQPGILSAALDEGTGVLTVTFDDNVVANTGNVDVRDGSGATHDAATDARVDISSATFTGATMTLTLGEADRQKAIDMSDPWVYLDAMAVTAGTGSVQADNAAVSATIEDSKDAVPPKFHPDIAPTVDEATGVLTITFDETVKADDAEVDQFRLYIKDGPGESNGGDGTRLSQAAVTSTGESQTVTLVLPESLRQDVAGYEGDPYLMNDTNAIVDTTGDIRNAVNADNTVAADHVGVKVTVIDDEVPPQLSSTAPALDAGTGVLTITFDESVKQGTDVDLTKIFMRDGSGITGGTALGGTTQSPAPLGDATASSGADADIAVTLNADQLQAAAGYVIPHLYFEAGAVKDFSDNGIGASTASSEISTNTAPPQLHATTPPVIFAGERTLVLTFNETVRAGSADLTKIFIRNGAVTSGGFSLAAGAAVTSTGNSPSIVISLDSTHITGSNGFDRHVHLLAGAVQDITGLDNAETASTPATFVQEFDTTPRGAAALMNGDGAFDLWTPEDVELISSGGKLYALVLDPGENQLSAFDVSDPDKAVFLWSKVNGQADGADNYGLSLLNDIDTVTIGGKLYAVVTSPGSPKGGSFPDGRIVPTSAQWTGGLQIIDVTDPSSPIFVSYTNQGDADANGRTFDQLAGAGGSAIFELGGRTYVVTGGDGGERYYGGIQISDITDPAAPLAVSSVKTADAFGTEPEHSNLEGERNRVDVVSINGAPYALMTADAKSTPGSSTMTGSLTVINLANVAAPAHASTIKLDDVDPDGDEFDVMYRPSSVVSATIGGKPYAFVTPSAEQGRKAGVQAIDLSDPTAPRAAASLVDGEGFDALSGARDMHVGVIDDKTYLFAPSYHESTLSIIDVSDPSAPVQASVLADEATATVGKWPERLIGASGVDTASVGNKTYAMVAAADSPLLMMLDVTDPSSPLARGTVADGISGYAGLQSPIHVTSVEVGPRQYLAVTDYGGNAVQVVDITNPDEPRAVSTVFDNARTSQLPGDGGSIKMQGIIKPRGLDSFTGTVGGTERTYLIITSDNGAAGAFTIMDITVPSTPTHVFTGRDHHATDRPNSPFRGLAGASDVATYEVAGTTYAIISGRADGAMQIVDLTDPSQPTAAGLARHDADDSQTPAVKYKLVRPYGIDVFTIASGTNAGTYAAVAAIQSDGIQIIKLDDPANLEATGFAADTSAVHAGSNTCSVCLQRANQVKAVTIDIFGGETPHLIVASKTDDGVQIINVGNPASPSLDSGRGDGRTIGTTSFKLDGAYGVDTFSLGSEGTFAAVTCQSSTCNGVQTIRLNNTSFPTPSAFLEDGMSGFAASRYSTDPATRELIITEYQTPDITELQGARGIATFVGKDGWTYAAVASFNDEGVQIIRLGGKAVSSEPALRSAVLRDGQTLELTFDALIDASEVRLGGIAISPPGLSNANRLNGASLEAGSDDVTLRIVLTQDQAAAVRSLPAIQVDFEPGAVRNAGGVPIGLSHDHDVEKISTAPAYRAAVLDLSSGVLIMAFDSYVDPASADLSKISLHDGGTKHDLTGSNSVTSLNRTWVPLRVGEELRQTLIVLSSSTSSPSPSLQLDLDADALSGSSGAGVAALENAHVRVLADDRHPRLEYAVYAEGVLSLTFDETVDMSRSDNSKMTLVSGSARLALSSSTITSAQDSPTVEMSVDQATMAQIGAGALSVDLAREAVWDTSGNHVFQVERIVGEPPRLASAEATSPDTIVVQLTKPVTGTGQLHPAWSLHGADAPGLAVDSVVLDGDSVTLRLNGDFPDTAPDVDVEYEFGRVSLVDQDGLELADGRVSVSDKLVPGLASARASSLTSVDVEFTEPVAGVSASGAGWTISGADSAGRTVTSAVLGTPPDSVRLGLSGPLADTAPSISLRYDPSGSVQDLSSNVMPAASLDSVQDGIAPAFVSASLQGQRSLLVQYSEPVTSRAADYVQISSGTSTLSVGSVEGSPGSSILVMLAPSSATFVIGQEIRFTIAATVADLESNTLSNAGQYTISASETAGADRLVLNPPGDGRAALPLTQDTFVRTVVLESGASVDLDLSSLTGPDAAHPRVAAAGDAAVFANDLAVTVPSGTVTFPSGLQVGGLGPQDLVRVGVGAAALPDDFAAFAASIGLDASRAVTVLELGDPARTLSFSEPVRIDLAEPLSEIVYVIRPDGPAQVLSCGAEIATPAAAEAAIAALAMSPTSDAQACFSGDRTIWTLSFSLWGSGPALPSGPGPVPGPEPGPEPETVTPAEQVIRRGGGGGGGGLRAPLAAPGPSESVYVGTVSWDCSAARVTVLAGPDSDGLSVSVMSSILGSVQAQEDIEARGENGMRKFVAPMSAEEDFLQVTAMHISARDFIQDRQSVDVDQCAGSEVFWTPAQAAAQQVPRAEPQTGQQTDEPDAIETRPPTTEQDAEPAAQCPPGMVTGADGSCSEPELTQEPPETEMPTVECGPGTVMNADGTCAVAPAEVSDQNGCLVATAAYGTELAPAVQKLREIRDGALAGTGSGAAFMYAFNSAYYAFSPAVADLERQSPAFKEAVKIAITPMIYSLQIMDGAESDPQVTAYGLAVIALNLAMYGGAPAAALYVCARKRQAAP